MSRAKEAPRLEFVPDVVGAHTTVFRSALPHSDEFFDEADPDDMAYGSDPRLLGTEDRIRVEVERELRNQMQNHLNTLQQDVDQRLSDFSSQFEENRRAYESGLRAAATQLAIAVAERVLRREIESDRSVVERVLDEVIGEIATRGEVRIHVHPADAEHLSKQPELLSRLRIREVVEDPSMEAGGCRLESGSLTWDASIEEQLAEVRARVDAALESA